MSKNQKILRALDRSFGLSFAELCGRLNESRENLRKNMNALHKDGRVARAVDEDGIVHYNITSKGKSSLVAGLLTALIIGPNSETALVQDYGRQGYNVITRDGTTMVRNYGGIEMITAPNGATTSIYDFNPPTVAPSTAIVPVVPIQPWME